MRMMVTGAGSGIGREVARLASQGNNDLALIGRSARVMDVVRSLNRASDSRAIGIVADLSVPAEVERSVELAADRLGGIDALVSNAGTLLPQSLLALDIATYEAVFALNTRATWLLAKASYEFLAEARGSIVATSSIAALTPAPGLGAYSASKAALQMLIQQMAVEWGPSGIRCNCVSPGPTVTGMTEGVFTDMDDPRQRAVRERRESHIPLGRVGTAGDVAQAVLFLCSEASGYITGTNLVVDGGLALALMPAVGGGRDDETGQTRPHR